MRYMERSFKRRGKNSGRYSMLGISTIFAVVLALSIVTTGSVFADMAGMNHREDAKGVEDGNTTKTVDGVTATIKVLSKMVDLILVDAESKELVKGAEVEAMIVYAGSHKIIKKLIGMKMGKGYSYMNSIDMSEKGGYTLHLMVMAGKRMIHIEFTGEVK